MRSIVNMSEEDRATHEHRQHAQEIGKDRTCGSGDILADRQTYSQTHRHTHHNTSQALPWAK